VGGFFYARYNSTVRRFVRILLNAATALSLLLFVATVALWVRSYWVQDSFIYSGGVRDDRLPGGGGMSYVGGLSVSWHVFHVAPGRGGAYERQYQLWNSHVPRGLTFQSSVVTAADQRLLAPLARFMFEPGGDRSYNEGDVVRVRYGGAAAPHWVPMVAFALPPLLWLRRTRRLRRSRVRGRCAQCGYDLRATPDRCPECGTAPKIPATKSN